MQYVKPQSKTRTGRQNRIVLLTVLAVMIITFVVTLGICYHALQNESYARYVGIMDVAAEKIAKSVRGMEMNAKNVFDEVEKHLDSPEAVIAALESKASLNPDVSGYFAAFEPEYFPEKGTWFEPYVHHNDSSDYEMTQVGSARHNYHRTEWYVRAKESGESFWADPYYYYDGTDISGHYTTFVKPILDENGKLVCVCGADMTFEWLTKELQRINEEFKNDDMLKHKQSDFYIVVMNNDGSCIAYPDERSVSMTEDDVIHNMSQKKSGIVNMTIYGVPSTVYYGPIDHINWTAVLVVPQHSLLKQLLTPALIMLAIAVIGLLIVWLVCRRRKDAEAV